MPTKLELAEQKFLRATAARAAVHAKNAIENLPPEASMSGLGWGFSMKNLTEAFHHATKQVVALHTKPFQFLKLAVTNPSKAIKYAQKEATGLANQTLKVGKQVAPYAVAGAALYFGGPYALTALKAAGPYALSALKGFASLPQPQQQAMQAQYADQAQADPNAAAALQAQYAALANQPAPPPQLAQQLISAPVAQNAANYAVQDQIQQTTGAAMDSPEAQDLVQAQVEDTSKNLGTKPHDTGGSALLGYGALALVLAKALL